MASRSTLAMAALITSIGFSAAASAGQVTCSSTNGKYVECRLDGSGDIVMKQQLSKTNCTKDVNWGETANGVYVKGGCRAIFETMSMNQPYNYGGGSGYQDLIGAKAAGGESDLKSRGYTWVRTATQGNSKLSYWRKPKNAGCIQVTTSDGRYSAIRDVNISQCAQGSGSGGSAQPAKYKDLVGEDSIRAIDRMSERGFTNVDDIQSGNTQYGIFFNRNTRQCVQLAMANGRVASADDIQTHPKCR